MEIPAIAYVSCISYSIPVIAGIFRFRRLNIAMKVLLLLCLCICLEIGGEYVLGRNHINNAFLSNDSEPVETLFICAVYFLSIKREIVKRIIFMLALLYSGIWIVDKIYFDVPNQLNNEMSILSGIFIITISVLTIHTTVNDANRPIVDTPIFWVSAGALVYSAGSLFIFGFSNELLTLGTSYFQTAWYINWTLAIIANATYAKGFFCTAESQTHIMGP